MIQTLSIVCCCCGCWSPPITRARFSTGLARVPRLSSTATAAPAQAEPVADTTFATGGAGQEAAGLRSDVSGADAGPPIGDTSERPPTTAAPVAETVAPVTAAVEPVTATNVEPVTAVVEPVTAAVIEPVTAAVEPVTSTVIEPVAAVVEQLRTAHGPPAGHPSHLRPGETPEQWEARFMEWVNSHVSRNPHFDDSRDSIYD